MNLTFSATTGGLTAVAPPDGNIAPAGYYMLFLLNSHGVPSVARFVHISAAPANQAPSASIDSPASAVTILAGQSVSFAGSGSDADGSVASHAWTFPGGTPTSSAAATPGSVLCQAGGVYAASYTVTDDDGAPSATVSRNIIVEDFALGGTAASVTLGPGTSGGLTIDVGALGGFDGAVALSLSGLPPGATGAATLTISTKKNLAPGSYVFTVSATSGGAARQVTATLVVQ